MTEASETSEIAFDLVDDGPCRKRLKAEIPADRVVKEVDDNYKQLVATVQLPGFRKGRVPRSVLERRYADKIEEEVREEMMQSSFMEEVDKRELKVVGAPKFEEVQFTVGEPFSYDAVFEVFPEFDLGDYTGIEIDARPVEVTGEDVERELESLREQFAKLEPMEFGDLSEGDIVGSDITLTKIGDDGEKDEEATIDRQDVYLKIGTNRVDNINVEDLSERLLKTTEGADLEFEVQIPEDFPREDLRDGKATLSVKVKSAQRKVVPEIDDDFLGKFGVDSAEKLNEELRGNIEARRRVQEEQRQEEELLETLAARVDMELPPSIIERRQHELTLQLHYRLMREGKSKEEIEKLVEEDTGAAEDARKEIKQLFILDSIAEKENILVTEDEVLQRIQTIALTYNRDPQEVLEEYQSRGELDEVRAGLVREKVRTLLREKANVVSENGSGSDDSKGEQSNEEADDAGSESESSDESENED